MIEAHTHFHYMTENTEMLSAQNKNIPCHSHSLSSITLVLPSFEHLTHGYPTECKPWAMHPQTRQSSEDSNECWWGVLLMVIRRWLLAIEIQDSASFWAPEVTNYPGCICQEVSVSVRSSVTCWVLHKPSSNPESSVDKVLVLFTILLSGKWFGVYSHLLFCW